MKPTTCILAWLISLRLKTLSLSVSSISVGSALAYWYDQFNPLIFILTLITACLLQILSNLANDYGDGIKGSDKQERIGPKRGLQLGLITQKQLLNAIIINVLLCIAMGISLLITAYRSLPELVIFLLIGSISLIAAITYTIGKKPYGYAGFGDISVFIFFGLVSVIGSFYLQTNQFYLPLLLPAISCGLLAVGVLNLNNLRDYVSDKINNKRTIVVWFGTLFARYYQCMILITSFVILCLFSLYFLNSYYSWLFLITLPLLFKQIMLMWHYTPESANVAFGGMIRLALLTNVSYIIGIILS